jgi:hypothetical protein
MVGIRVVAFVFSLVAIAGCGGADANRRPTAPVKVTVKYKGKPVENAIVQFITRENPQPAVGTTDASGSCSMKTYEANDGAIIGLNDVTISKSELDAKNVRAVAPEDADLVGITPVPHLKSAIPQKYASPTTSGIQADVVKGKNEFEYELKD